jgi:tetratricopeptide (TPR) repeat protein
VHLSIQLYDAAKDRQLYARTFSDDMQNLYSILDEMTRGVAAALGVGIRPGSQVGLGEQKPVDPAAIEAYLIGMSYCYKYTPASLSKAIEYLEKSIAIDSTFAKAYAGLAETYNSYRWLGMQPAENTRPLVKKYIDRALSLDPKQPQAIGALGDYKFKFKNDVKGAEEEYLRALDLDPNMAGYHNSYAFLLLFKGDCDGAVKEAKLAKMFDPANAVWIVGIGVIFHDCFRFDSALVYFNEAIRKDNTEHGSYLYRSSVYATMGMYRKALGDVERAVTLGREDMWPVLAAWYVNLGDTARARAGFRRVLEQAPKGYYGPSTLAVARYWLGGRGRLDSTLALEKSPIELAFAYCCLGELDKAFVILEDKYRNRPLDMVKLINDPSFALLTRHQRYNDLLKKAGMKK